MRHAAKQEGDMETRWNDHFADLLRQKRPVATESLIAEPRYSVMHKFYRDTSVEEAWQACQMGKYHVQIVSRRTAEARQLSS